MNNNKLWDSNDWQNGISAIRQGNEAEMAPFFERLTFTPLLIPRSKDKKGVALLATQDEKFFIPAFTDNNEYCKWLGGETASLCSFVFLRGMVTDDKRLEGIVINPFNPQFQLLLPRQMLNQIENSTTGMTVERIDHEGKTLLDKAECPPKLLQSYIQALDKSGLEIFEAYILMARQEHEDKPHLMFLIDFNGDRKRLFPQIAQALQPHLQKGTQFELMKANRRLLAAARAKTSPVYKGKI